MNPTMDRPIFFSGSTMAYPTTLFSRCARTRFLWGCTRGNFNADMRPEVVSGHSLWPCGPVSSNNLWRESMSVFVKLRSFMLD